MQVVRDNEALSGNMSENRKYAYKRHEKRVSPVTTKRNTGSDIFAIPNGSSADFKPSRPDSPADIGHLNFDSPRKSSSLMKRHSIESSVSTRPYSTTLDNNDFPSLGTGSNSAGHDWLKKVSAQKPLNSKEKVIDWFDNNVAAQCVKTDTFATMNKTQFNSIKTDQSVTCSSQSKIMKTEMRTAYSERPTRYDTSKNTDNASLPTSNALLFPFPGKGVTSDHNKKLDKIDYECNTYITSNPSLFDDSIDCHSLPTAVVTASKVLSSGLASFMPGCTAPPGFDSIGDLTGLSSSSPECSSMAAAAKTKDSTLSLISRDVLPMVPSKITPTADNLEYAQPKDFCTRNTALVAKIQYSIGNCSNKFHNFVTWSREFRNGDITGKDFCEKCECLFGQEWFYSIFPELLALLPDIDKQRELLKAYNIRESKSRFNDHALTVASLSKGRTHFQSCPMCRQVLLPVDYEKHISNVCKRKHFALAFVLVPNSR